MALKSFPCPKCGRLLEPSGVASVEGETVFSLPTYQCDVCVRRVNFMGEWMDLPLTFVVENGRAVDPADPDADLSK